MSRRAHERLAQRGFGALDFTEIALHFGKIGCGQRIVGPQRKRSCKRALRIREPAQRALRVAEVVPGARAAGVEPQRLFERRSGVRSVAGLTPEDP